MYRIHQCLNNQLLKIYDQAKQLNTLTTLIRQCLPHSLAKHCHVGSFIKGCLIITTTNVAWATELYYSLPALRDQLRTEAKLYQLASIKVSIEETHHPIQPLESFKATPLSSKARQIIQEAAEQCSFLPLKEALSQLAKNVRK